MKLFPKKRINSGKNTPVLLLILSVFHFPKRPMLFFPLSGQMSVSAIKPCGWEDNSSSSSYNKGLRFQLRNIKNGVPPMCEGYCNLIMFFLSNTKHERKNMGGSQTFHRNCVFRNYFCKVLLKRFAKIIFNPKISHLHYE